MTSEAKQEMELMIDTVDELSSQLQDYQLAEEDDTDDFAPGTDDAKLNRFNVKELKLVQSQLDKVKATLQNLVKQN